MVKIRTHFNFGNFANQRCGDPLRHELKAVTDEHGCLRTYVFDSIRIQDEIDSYLNDTLVSNVLARAALGDTSGLRKVPAQYVDCSSMQHRTFADLHAEAQRADALFSMLPEELKNGCTSASDFFDKCNTATIASLFTAYSDKLSKLANTPKEVNTNE